MTAARCSVVIAFAFLVLLTDYEATRTTQLPLMLMLFEATYIQQFHSKG